MNSSFLIILFLSLFYFRKNILLLLLYPKHVIKLLWHNLRCYSYIIVLLYEIMHHNNMITVTWVMKVKENTRIILL